MNAKDARDAMFAGAIGAVAFLSALMVMFVVAMSVHSLLNWISDESDSTEIATAPKPEPLAPGEVWEHRINANPWGADVRLWTVLAVSNGWVRYETETGYVGAIEDWVFRSGGAKRVM